MDNGSLPLCADLGQSQEHHLLYWLGRKARKDGLVAQEYSRLVESAARGAETFKSPHAVKRAERSIRELFSAGYIEKVDVGDSFGFRVLVICSGKIPVEDLTEPYPPQAARPIIAPQGRGDGEATTCLSLSTSDVVSNFTTNGSEKWHPFAQKQGRAKSPTGRLAQETFPQLLAANGVNLISGEHKWYALAQHLGRWRQGGTSVSQIHLMMEEFARHPEWVNRSRKPAWQVFVGRREELAALVRSQRSREPNRQNTWGRHTPLASSPA